jgi:hypothetical protein
VNSDRGSGARCGYPYLDYFFRGELDRAKCFLAADFVFDGPLSHHESVAEFLDAADDFPSTLRHGWRETVVYGAQMKGNPPSA